MLNYIEVLDKKFHDQYIDNHKSIFYAFNRMLYEISFIKAIIKWQTKLNEIDAYFGSERHLYAIMFSELIINAYKCFFDHGGGAISIERLKNDVVTHCNETHKNAVTNCVKDSLWCSQELKELKKSVKPELHSFRNSLIAHNLYDPSLFACVNVDDIARLLEAACDLFTRISFEPTSFYGKSELHGFCFEIGKDLFGFEKTAIEENIEQFFRAQIINSSIVSKVELKYHAYYSTDEISPLIDELETINVSKRKAKMTPMLGCKK